MDGGYRPQNWGRAAGLEGVGHCNPKLGCMAQIGGRYMKLNTNKVGVTAWEDTLTVGNDVCHKKKKVIVDFGVLQWKDLLQIHFSSLEHRLCDTR
jgi:hypothetical protein